MSLLLWLKLIWIEMKFNFNISLVLNLKAWTRFFVYFISNLFQRHKQAHLRINEHRKNIVHDTRFKPAKLHKIAPNNLMKAKLNHQAKPETKRLDEYSLRNYGLGIYDEQFSFGMRLKVPSHSSLCTNIFIVIVVGYSKSFHILEHAKAFFLQSWAAGIMFSLRILNEASPGLLPVHLNGGKIGLPVVQRRAENYHKIIVASSNLYRIQITINSELQCRHFFEAIAALNKWNEFKQVKRHARHRRWATYEWFRIGRN